MIVSVSADHYNATVLDGKQTGTDHRVSIVSRGSIGGAESEQNSTFLKAVSKVLDTEGGAVLAMRSAALLSCSALMLLLHLKLLGFYHC